MRIVFCWDNRRSRMAAEMHGIVREQGVPNDKPTRQRIAYSQSSMVK